MRLTLLALMLVVGCVANPEEQKSGLGVEDADGDGFYAGDDCDDEDPAVNPEADERCNGVDDDCDGVVDEDAVDAALWYQDEDQDGFGWNDAVLASCEQPSGYVADPSDCDDGDSQTHPGADEWCDGVDRDCNGVVDDDYALDALTWFADSDADGFGDASVSQPACEQPSGYLNDGTDCDDGDASIHPGADEYCNGVDDDCDGEVDEDDAVDASTLWVDADGDGYGDSAAEPITCCDCPDGYATDNTDCNDADSAIYTGANEWCDGVDSDCDGTVDNDAQDATTWYVDADGDGYGDAGTAVTTCDQPTGYVADDTDCDDGDAASRPGGDEWCDGVDRDCNGTVDDDYAMDATTWYVDRDGDGHGDAGTYTVSCYVPSGYTADSSDCDDFDSSTNPGVDEWCDGVDRDCNGTVDDDYALDASTWSIDADGDGHGDASGGTVSCDGPSGYVANTSDCDDGDGSVYLGADEHCDGIDNDCDGDVDEDDAVDALTAYADLDGDGYGDASDAGTSICVLPSGTVTDNTDCDDTDAATFPGAEEWCDGVDRDCNGVVDDDYASDASTWYTDGDGDGYGDGGTGTTTCTAPSGTVLNGTDCDDGEVSVNPGADEYCDGLDNDCNGVVDDDYALDAVSWYYDADGDFYGDASVVLSSCGVFLNYVADNTDCDDGDALVYPGADEYCSGVDEDCNGIADDDYAVDILHCRVDDDGDGHGDVHDSGVAACACASGYAPNNDDCVDSDASVYTGADEYCDSVDNDCDGVVDEDDAVDAISWHPDADADGYGDAGTVAAVSCMAGGMGIPDGSDCDDTNPDVNPDAFEVCDGLDNDCDGNVDNDATDGDVYYPDLDLDGYGDSGGAYTACSVPSGYVYDGSDCDDADPDVNPGGTEVCDKLDNDCDGTVDDPDELIGSADGCPGESCADILAVRAITATDGTYYVDPADTGVGLEVLCEMDIDGGGWTQACDLYLAELSVESREYLYTYGGAWYLSPVTDLVWDWTSYQSVVGDWSCSTGSDWAEGTFFCSDFETGSFGLGCSDGITGSYKVLPSGTGQDADAATGPICQDVPDAFGVGSCASGVSIWVR